MSDPIAIALIGMGGITSAAAITGWFNRHRTAAKLEQIHLLVNSRLTDALVELASLKKTIAAMLPKDLDRAQQAVDAAKDAARAKENEVKP